jgi:hypothetical protein
MVAAQRKVATDADGETKARVTMLIAVGVGTTGWVEHVNPPGKTGRIRKIHAARSEAGSANNRPF